MKIQGSCFLFQLSKVVDLRAVLYCNSLASMLVY